MCPVLNSKHCASNHQFCCIAWPNMQACGKKNKYLYLYPVCKIWYQCILANYIALSLSDSVEKKAVIVCIWFSGVVKLCITCIAGWAKIRIVLGMEPRVPLSSLTHVLITAVTNPLSLSRTHTRAHTGKEADEWWMKHCRNKENGCMDG